MPEKQEKKRNSNLGWLSNRLGLELLLTAAGSWSTQCSNRCDAVLKNRGYVAHTYILYTHIHTSPEQSFVFATDVVKTRQTRQIEVKVAGCKSTHVFLFHITFF